MARPDRVFAFIAFVLTLTALLLPWWLYTVDANGIRDQTEVHAFRPVDGLSTSWGPWLTGVLAASAAVLLFVRLAASSHLHEPASWRRDVGVAGGLLLLAAASCLLWPEGIPFFWGGRTFDQGGVSNTQSAMPGLGWWLAVVAGLLCVGAFWKAGRALAGGADADGAIQK